MASNNRKNQWIAWLILGLLILAFLWVAGAAFMFWGWRHVGMWDVMGGWHRGVLIGRWGFGPFGLLLGLTGLIFRAGLFVLLILGGIWLWHRLSGPQGASSGATTATCPHCGRAVQSDWRHCPHCGQPLGRANDQAAPPSDITHV